MIVINAPLKKEIFQKVAEEAGLIYLKTSGMKLYFENPTEEADQAFAEKLKKLCKKNKELSAIYFNVVTEG